MIVLKRLLEGGASRPGTVEGLLGVVLCGGHSRRMGVDKASLSRDGSSLLERAATTLQALAPRVLLACGTQQRYAELGLETILDLREGCGPLAGLEAALEHAAARREEHDWVAILACDLPGARPELYHCLLARAREQRLDACLLASERGLEPLLAVYRPSCLAPVRAALDAGERRMLSFLEGRDELRVGSLELGELPEELGGAGCVRNLNTPRGLAHGAGGEPMRGSRAHSSPSFWRRSRRAWGACAPCSRNSSASARERSRT